MKKRDASTSAKLQKIGNKRASYEKARKLKNKQNKLHKANKEPTKD